MNHESITCGIIYGPVQMKCNVPEFFQNVISPKIVDFKNFFVLVLIARISCKFGLFPSQILSKLKINFFKDY
jgi:hypothetical protein